MTKNQPNFLPFWDTVGRSFKYVFKNKALLLGVVPLILILFVLQILLGRPFLCVLSENCLAQGPFSDSFFSFGGIFLSWAHLFGIIALALGAAGVVISYCRMLIVRERPNIFSFSFIKRILFYFFARFVFNIFLFVLFFVLTFVFVRLLDLFYLLATTLALFSALLLTAPILLVFPSISVDDYRFLNFKSLYRSAHGNFNALFWGQCAIMTPYWVFLSGLKGLYTFLPETYLFSSLFLFVFLVLSVLDSCFKGAFFAHIYNFFQKNL